MKNNSVTACLVIHNEEAVLSRCLDSIKDVVDQILIVHDGDCTDNSLKIAQKYKAKVFIREFVGEAEPHRAWLYKQVQSDWILHLDADEALSTELKEKIHTLKKADNVACYEFLWPYWDGRKLRTKKWPWRKVLFRTNAITYLAFPHEEIRVKGYVKRVPLRVDHRPKYDNLTLSSFNTKWRKWIKVHAQYLKKDPESFDQFPDSGEKLIPHYYFIKDQPLLSAIPLFFYHFLGLYILGKGYKEGFYAFKASLFMATYYFLLCFEVWRLKK